MSDVDSAWADGLASARRRPRRTAHELTMVIPTLGREIVAQCLGAIVSGTVWPARIIVVDQGASAAIAGWVEELCLLGLESHHERCPGRGRALGLNVGLRLVTTRFVVITDDDCIPDPRWIELYEAHLKREFGAVFTGRVEAAGGERVISTVLGTEVSVARKPGFSFDRLSGGNCGMAVEVLQKVGLFDDDPCVRFAEDGEWAYRVLRAGIPIVYAPDLVVAHVGWRELGERLSQYRGYARSHGAFFGKHLKRGDLFVLLRACVHFARALRRWQRGMFSGDAELAANGRSYATQLVPGIIAGMKSRAQPPTLP